MQVGIGVNTKLWNVAYVYQSLIVALIQIFNEGFFGCVVFQKNEIFNTSSVTYAQVSFHDQSSPY